MPDTGPYWQSPEKVILGVLHQSRGGSLTSEAVAQEVLSALEREGYVVLSQESLAEKVTAPLRRLESFANRLMSDGKGS